MSKENLKPKMIEALKKSLGNVTAATDAVGITPFTHYKWFKEDEEYRREVENIKDRAIDFVEAKLMTLIKNGDTTATIFYLKTQGKGRGYTEKIETEQKIVADVKTIDEKKKELADIIDKITND